MFFLFFFVKSLHILQSLWTLQLCDLFQLKVEIISVAILLFTLLHIIFEWFEYEPAFKTGKEKVPFVFQDLLLIHYLFCTWNKSDHWSIFEVKTAFKGKLLFGKYLFEIRSMTSNFSTWSTVIVPCCNKTTVSQKLIFLFLRCPASLALSSADSLISDKLIT